MSLTLPNPILSLASHRSHFLVPLYLVTRRDAVQFRFTLHDTQVEFDDGAGIQTFSPAGAFDPSADRRESGLRDQNKSSRGATTAAGVTQADLHAGLFREAEVQEFIVDPRYPWAGAYRISRYWINELDFSNEEWRADVMGVTGWLSHESGRTHGRNCDADLFDARCGLLVSAVAHYDVTGVRVLSGTQVAADPRRKFAATFSDIPTSGPEADEYKHGKLTWTTGANTGIVSEVKEYTHVGSVPLGRPIELYLPTPYVIADLDEFTIVTGCDRTRSTCAGAKFNNLPNFRGWPFMPGTDDMIQTPNIPGT